MISHPPIHPFAPRLLQPIVAAGHSVDNGPLEPASRVTLPRGMRPGFGPGGAVAAGGGWPGQIIRQATFATILRPPVPVNVLTGIPTNPNNAKLVKRRAGRRWTL